MQQLIAGNWKMHCITTEAIALAEAIGAGALGIAAELLVCPTALHVAAVASGPKDQPSRLAARIATRQSKVLIPVTLLPRCFVMPAPHG